MSTWEDTLTKVMQAFLIGEALVGMIGAAYLIYAYLHRAGSSSAFYRMVRSDALIAFLCGTVIALAALVALANLPRLPFTGLAVGLAVAILLYAPISDAFYVRRLRRHRGDGSPPPWRDGD